MAQISEVTYRNIDEARRIDADYFSPIYLDLEKKLKDAIELEDILKYLTDGTHQTPKYKESGVPFLSSGNIHECFIDFDDVRYIGEGEHRRLSHCQPTKGDVLVSKSGRIGHSAVVPDEYTKGDFNIYEGVALLRSERINPYALALILNSEPLKKQIARKQKGVAQPHLHLEDILSLKIPRLSKDKEHYFAQVGRKYYQLKQKSKSLYSQAQQLLLKELDLEDFETEWVAGYETDRDSVLNAARMDAEYFQPKYNKIKEQILKADHAELEDLAVSIHKGVEVGSDAYQKEGVPFVRVSNMDVHEINDNNQQYISEDLFESLKDKHSPKEGEILLTKDGTPGIAHYVNSPNQTFTTISGGILRFEPKGIEPEYFTLALNSSVVQSQIAQDAGGALIKHWRPDQVKKTIIPILSEDKRQEIVDLVRQSSNALSESKKLLEQAKKEVEDMIEKQENV